MTETVHVQFTIPDGRREAFMESLQRWDRDTETCVGYRADDYVSRRAALIAFVDCMELKLRKNEHKTTWKEKPVQALVSLMILELEEFKVALEHFSVKEARDENPDIANFSMMIWDRLGSFNQDLNFRLQTDSMLVSKD